MGGESALEQALRLKFRGLVQALPDFSWFGRITAYGAITNPITDREVGNLFADNVKESESWLIFLCDDPLSGPGNTLPLIDVGESLSKMPNFTVVLLSGKEAGKGQQFQTTLPVFARDEALKEIRNMNSQGGYIDIITPWLRRQGNR